MAYYDEQLRHLQAQCSRKKQLEAQVRELQAQRSALERQAHELQAVMLDEQADVEKLEGASLAAFFYNVIGKMDEHLSKERAEAYAARVKYDAAARELAQVENDLQRSTGELAGLHGCDSRYEAVLREKADAVKAAGGPAAAEILRLEERQAFLGSQKRELEEAISAGRAAFETTQDVLDSLGHAESWGTWDLFGGGLISDMAKHSHLDEAQYAVERLQSQLRRFKTELADVTIHADMQVNVDGFLRFADYFFDGLFVDWAVLDRISQSQSQVLSTQSQIQHVLSQLNAMVQGADRELAQIKRQLDDLVLSAQI